jgi:carboxyl-terminal processing protease
MARFRTGNRSGVSLTIIILIGVFVGWKSALYSVRDQLDEPVDLPPLEQALSEPLNLELFWDVLALIENSYVDELAIDKEMELYGAIKGLVNSVDDPYTVFMTPEETNEFQASLEGSLQGIGAELTMKDNLLTVIAPLKGSPAEAAGVKPGDVIYMVDEELVGDMTLFEAIMEIRGEEGTDVTITVLRNGHNKPVDITITRAQIDIPSVSLEYKGENEKIAYINIYQFSDKTETEFDEVVQEMLLQDVDGLVLDLRYNGGGYLDVAVDILSDFIEGKETAVITKHREEGDNEVYYTNESGLLKDYPLVVLVNEGSASASEIIAGAVQDLERGLVMGNQTFGKGSVQVIERLDDGSSLRITIAKWYTPKDRSIDDIGIAPNTFVEITEEDMENELDPQLDAAVDYLEGRGVPETEEEV